MPTCVNPGKIGPHVNDLALLIVVLGIGTLVDLNLTPYSFGAQHYYRLLRATLALQPILGAQSVARGVKTSATSTELDSLDPRYCI